MSARLSDLPSLAVRRPVLVLVVNLLIIIGGLGAFMGVEVRELPDVDRPIVTVRAIYEGAAPETVDAEVTSVLEGAVARVTGVREISSSSEENNARIRIEFDPSVDLNTAANDVREAVARAERRLPDAVEDVSVVKADADAGAIIRLAVFSSTLSETELTRLAEDDVATELAAVPGVATVDIFGARERVLRVIVDPLRLASYGIGINEVADVLRGARFDVPAGSFQSRDQMLIVRADASVWREADVEALRVRPGVRLGDIAQAIYSPAEQDSYVRMDGNPVIGLGIVRQAQSNTIAISDGIDAAVERLNARLRDARIVKTSDDAEFIRGSVREVLITLGFAVAIVIGVIYVFLGSLRTTFIPATTIPVALIGTVAAIWLLGFSVNILTLLALVLATGLIVDDAIVVLENVQRRRAQGLPPLAAAVLGTRQVFFAVVATTATLISVFLPIAFLPSTAGRMFTEFGIVLAVAVAISSFVALSLAPMLASRLPPEPESGAQGGLRLWPLVARLGRWLAALYDRLLGLVLAAPVVVVGLALLGAVLALDVFRSIDEELLPREDRGRIIVSMQGPDGVGLDYMDRQVARVEEALRPFRESGVVDNVLSIVGRWDMNRALVVAPLAPWSERGQDQFDIAARLEETVSEIPGATARIYAPNSLDIRGAGGGFEFALTGSNYREIAAAADSFIAEIEERIPQLQDLRMSYQPTQPQLSVNIDRRRAEDLGVSVEGLAGILRAMVDGYEVAELNVEDRAVPIMLQSVGGAIADPGDLANLYVSTENDRMVPLSSFISIEEEGVAAELDRAGQRRAIEVDAAVDAGYTLRQAIEELNALAAETLPPGIGIRFLGEAATLEETSRDVAITFAIALAVVVLVLAAQFESFLSAAVVVLTVPFGLAAAVFALSATGTSINIYSQIGLVMLVGLMSKNGILIVEFADQLRDRGLAVPEAIRRASNVRLRPVMMTMLSTVMGAVPLVLSSGPGSEAREAIGWVVVGGLGVSTLFTLFITPLVYSLLAPLAKPRAHAGVRLARELDQAGRVEEPALAKAAE